MDNCDFVEKILNNRAILNEEINEYFLRCKKLRRTEIRVCFKLSYFKFSFLIVEICLLFC